LGYRVSHFPRRGFPRPLCRRERVLPRGKAHDHRAEGVIGLHQLDFAWGYTQPDFAPWGFTIAVLIAFALSLFGLTASLERETKTRAELEFHIAYKARLANASRLSALGEMAGGMAHEMNSPLATIQLLSETALAQSRAARPSLDSIGVRSKRSTATREDSPASCAAY